MISTIFPNGTIQEGGRSSDAAGLAMSRLMAVAGHDLKQPLQLGILSVSRALTEGVPNPAAKWLSIALEAMKRLGGELTDIARLSQMEDGLQPRLHIVPVNSILRHLESDWQVYAEACQVELRIHDHDAFVETDPDMLRSILRNLVSNAIKYCGPGGHVDVHCRIEEQKLHVEVEDDGCGIPLDRLARVFDAFERCGQADQSEGLGLGLLIARQTAELLRHRITARSIVNVGSNFSIEVPLARVST